MEKIKLRLYSPHAAQVLFHNSKARYRVAAWGRQAGKSTACLNEMVAKAWMNPMSNYWFVSPTFQQAKGQFRKLKNMLWGTPVIVLKNEQELRIQFLNKSIIRFISGEVLHNLRGETLDGCVIDEVREQNKDLWPQVISPMLRTTGGWAAFVSTPKGYDQFYDFAQRAKHSDQWEFFTAPSTCNPLFTEKEAQDAKESMTDEVFRQEILAEFIDITKGTAYRGFHEQNIVTRNPFAPDRTWSPYLPIIVGLDFNVNPMGWALGQTRSEKFYWGKEIHIEGTDTQEACQELIPLVKGHGPGVVLCGDASGKARNTSAKAGATDYSIIKEELCKHGIRFTDKTPRANPFVRDRVNIVNSKLRSADGAVSMWVHEDCKHLIRDLRRVAWKTGSNSILDKTTDTTLTHLSDAMGYPVYAMSKIYKPKVGGLKVIARSF